MSGYQLQKVGLSIPDYFGGHHKPVLQVPVWKDMTKTQLTEAIVSEYHETWDHLCSYPGNELNWPDLEEDELKVMCDEFILTDIPFNNSNIDTLQECIDNEDNDSTYLFMVWEKSDE